MVDDWGEARANRQRLAVELRRLRDLAGLSGRELAQRIGISQSKVSRIESGTAIPSSPVIKAWAGAVAVSPETEALLLELTEAALTEVHTWRKVLTDRTNLQGDIQEQERTARRVYTFQPSVIPGLLQTAEYGRRVFSLFQPPFAADDIPAVLAGRLDRQLALYEEGRRFDFLITEAALRWRPGPPRLLLAQLDRLASVSTLENVTIGLISHAVEAGTNTSHGFVILDRGCGGRTDEESPAGDGDASFDQETQAGGEDDGTIVTVETIHANLVVQGEHVALYRNRWERLSRMAVFGDDARAFLSEVAADIRKLEA